MIGILTAVDGEVVEQLLGFSLVEIVVRMAGFAAVGNDKGVGYNGNAFAVAFVGMGNESTDQQPLML